MLSNGGYESEKEAHEVKMPNLPLQKVTANAMWGVKVKVDRLQVFGFNVFTRDNKN
jgi:hypothetical protein